MSVILTLTLEDSEKVIESVRELIQVIYEWVSVCSVLVALWVYLCALAQWKGLISDILDLLNQTEGIVDLDSDATPIISTRDSMKCQVWRVLDPPTTLSHTSLQLIAFLERQLIPTW